MKESGIVLHISSLNTEYGIGDFGPEAYRFADYLAINGHKYWQILPLNHPGYGNSPYNPLSAFAGNPYLISPQLLLDEGLLKRSELKTLSSDSQIVDYAKVCQLKDELLHKAAKRYLEQHDIAGFYSEHKDFLEPYISFMLLSERFGSNEWYHWPKEYRRYNPEIYKKFHNTDKAKEIISIQAIFDEQLSRLCTYVESKGLRFLGDVPIYLSYESAEVWAYQELFDLDDDGRRQSLAGVPPDAFSETGQLWGNPIYLWERMQKDGFSLFIRRFAHIFRYVHLLRLDHFIGYVNYWRIPCEKGLVPETAAGGAWVDALPAEFFARLRDHFSMDSFIAEDLGILNDKVCHYRDSLGLEGMIILQFCFDDGVQDIGAFPQNKLIYTGTHDNNTTRGWWNSLKKDSPTCQNIIDYCKSYHPQLLPINAENIANVMIEIAFKSGCDKVLIPMQDLLSLDERARMNTPGTPMGNWQWRMPKPIDKITP